MFEQFTDQARSVVVLAKDEARMLSHNYIGTEHILLGLICEGMEGECEGVAARVLTERMGQDLEILRATVFRVLEQLSINMNPPDTTPHQPQSAPSNTHTLRLPTALVRVRDQFGENSQEFKFALLGWMVSRR